MPIHQSHLPPLPPLPVIPPWVLLSAPLLVHAQYQHARLRMWHHALFRFVWSSPSQVMRGLASPALLMLCLRAWSADPCGPMLCLSAWSAQTSCRAPSPCTYTASGYSHIEYHCTTNHVVPPPPACATLYCCAGSFFLGLLRYLERSLSKTVTTPSFRSVQCGAGAVCVSTPTAATMPTKVHRHTQARTVTKCR